jgi:hypothetical protein
LEESPFGGATAVPGVTRHPEVSLWLSRLARYYAVDVLHLNQLTHGVLDVTAPVLTAVHSCALTWWLRVRGSGMPWYAARYRREVRASLASAGAVVTSTATMAQAVQEQYGPLPDVSVIANARPPAPPSLGGKTPVVLAVRAHDDDGASVASVERVAESLPWVTTIVDRATLSAREMASAYASAAIFVRPARIDAFALSVLDAAHDGCALVLGDTPELREQWDGAALFVPAGDDAALVHAITMLTRDGARRERLAAAARRRAARRSFDLFVREYVLAYRTLIGGYASLFEGVREAHAS